MNLLTKDTYMKHNLGRLVGILCLVYFSVTLLQAEDFTYDLRVTKTNPYVKEAVFLTFDVNQTNHDIVLLFDFDLVKKENYSYQRVDIKETNDAHDLHIRYTYLIYPLQDGEVDIHFKLRKRVTTEDSVAYSFSGDRDNVKGLVTKDYSINLPPFMLHVKPLQKDILLVGDFTLEYSLKNHQAKAYESLPFNFTLKGKGYPPRLNNILPKDIKFTLFSEKPNVHALSSKEGTHSTVNYTMALSHDKDFTLPAISLKAFNPLSEKTYTLHIPSQNFKITEVNKTTLVDKVNIPPLLKENWSWSKTLFSYFIVFISGYLTARAIHWQKKSSKTETIHPLREKIKLSKNKKELLQILMAHNNQHFSSCINMLEDSLYANGKMSLKELKEEALNLL